jgi:hypothetical protein
VFVIADVCYNGMKGYSMKYTVGETASTRSKHRNTQCDYIKIFYIKAKENVKLYPCNRPWRPVGLGDVGAPIFSRQSAHRWR